MSFASSVNCLLGDMDAHAYTMLILTQLPSGLIGDLVFKLNPGPLSRSIPTIVSRHESFRNNKGIGRRNPRNLISVQPNRPQSSFSKLLSLCLLNARSVRNKTAMIVG